MPIERYSDTSPRYFEPEETTQLARYFDLTKFLSLLKDERLFFCRLDKLEDRFEGTLPIASREDFRAYYQRLNSTNFLDKKLTDEKIEEKIKSNLEFREKLKALNCVNCWNEFESESYALWKVYSDINQGIMVKSSFARLIRAFSETEEKVFCSRIKYIDHEKDSIDIGNTMTPIVHKHRAYSYESEVRLIHEVKQNGWVHDWENEPFENGVKIKVDLSELIEEIIISPFAPIWFKDLIEDILKRYSLSCNLSISKLK